MAIPHLPMTSPSTPSRPRARPAAAFTLIELLTVIAIIGILAAIIIPTVGKVRQTAGNAKCSATLREWGRAVMLYANDNKGNYTMQGVKPDGSTPNRTWHDAGSNPYTGYFGKQSMEASRLFRGCSLSPLPDDGIPKVDYMLCRGFINGDPNTNAPYAKVPLGRAQNPSMLILMIDGIENGGSGNSNVAMEVTAKTSEGKLDKYVLPLIDQTAFGNITDPYWTQSAKRHGGRSINAVFADGSIKRVTATPAGQGDKNSILEMRETWFRIY